MLISFTMRISFEKNLIFFTLENRKLENKLGKVLPRKYDLRTRVNMNFYNKQSAKSNF